MAVSMIESVWKLMLENTFFIEDESMINDLKCTICKKLATDAVASSMCGCTFCYKCILNYTDNGDKYCPGNKEYCNDEHIVLERNAFRNSMLNKRILKVKVNCPNESCVCNIELAELEDHLRLCRKKPIDCSYTAINCATDMSTIDHLNDNTLGHTELFLDLIQNLKNEVNGLKDKLVKSELNILSIKKVSLEREDKMVRLVQELGQKITEMEIRVNEETAKRENEKNEEKRQIEEARIEKENLVTLLNGLRKDIDKLRNVKETFNQDLVAQRVNVREFIWRFNQYTLKINAEMFSESFYSNNRTWCINMYINTNKNDIRLRCHIMKDDNDDKVQWPMVQIVTLSIQNQATLTSYRTEKYQGTFSRPFKGIGQYVGETSFIDDYSSIANDSIFVSCVITDQ